MSVIGGLKIADVTQIVQLVTMIRAELCCITIVDALNIENEHLQIAFPCNRRVSLTQRASSAVAGIRKELLPCFRLLCIGCFKVLFRHIALATEFDFADTLGQLDAARQASEGCDIGGHILTNMAVTARRSLGQIGKTIVRTFVDKRQAQTVDFALHREGYIGVFSFHRIHKAADLIIGKHIKQRKHRYTVFNRNTENTLAANNLCRAVSGHELRMCRFDITNLVHHGIVFLIRYNRSILLIVGGTPFFGFGAEIIIMFLDGRNRHVVRHNILPHICIVLFFCEPPHLSLTAIDGEECAS